MHTKQEFSSGGVVFKKEKDTVVFLLGKHSGYHKWVLPKGLIEEMEEAHQTAVRETEEEMGVVAKIVGEKPIHEDRYEYYAKLKDQNLKIKSEIKNTKVNNNTRRVDRYAEDGGGETKVFKTVIFYLMEYVSGDPAEHGWEMEDVGWFSFDEAMKRMSFDGEKKALQIARDMIE